MAAAASTLCPPAGNTHAPRSRHGGLRWGTLYQVDHLSIHIWWRNKEMHFITCCKNMYWLRLWHFSVLVGQKEHYWAVVTCNSNMSLFHRHSCHPDKKICVQFFLKTRKSLHYNQIFPCYNHTFVSLSLHVIITKASCLNWIHLYVVNKCCKDMNISCNSLKQLSLIWGTALSWDSTELACVTPLQITRSVKTVGQMSLTETVEPYICTLHQWTCRRIFDWSHNGV